MDILSYIYRALWLSHLLRGALAVSWQIVHCLDMADGGVNPLISICRNCSI